MKPATAVLLLLAPAARLMSGASSEAPIPAARVPGPSNPESFGMITVVGSTMEEGARDGAPPRVFAVEVADMRAEVAAAAGVTEHEIPRNVRWPDAHDRIEAGLAGDAAGRGAPGARNPWEVRPRPKGTAAETVLFCGGVIEGDGVDPVAILNGRVVRRGDAVGAFSVEGVAATGVVLERNGAFFMIPLGRRTTLSDAEP